MKRIIQLLSVVLLVALTVTAKADNDLNKALQFSGKNRSELEKAINAFKGEKKEAIIFLVKYMPERDLKELTAAFLIENVKMAYKARTEFAWAKQLSKDIFFNEVLPYASLNERRDSWRTDFYNRFKKYVVNAKTADEAVWQVNNNILKELKVEYNTKRKKPDQSPYESMEIKMASCSGLSILLTDAFRAVGIPARIAGTPNWYNNSGNHNWVEVYVNGQWHFTEYYPSGKYDESWFLDRAGKADRKNPDQWMYASSFKPTGLSFPLVWDETIKYVPAVNVTERYFELYAKQHKNADNVYALQVVMLNEESCSISGNNRVRAEVKLLSDGKEVDNGTTCGPEDDMNRFLTFKLEKGKNYQLRYVNIKGEEKTKDIEPMTEDSQIILNIL